MQDMATSSTRRLRVLATQLTPLSTSATTSHPLLALLPLSIEGETEHGCFSPALGVVRSAIADATQSRQYRMAAALSDLLYVVEPKPPLSVDECAPSDPDAAAAFFVENGFVCVR